MFTGENNNASTPPPQPQHRSQTLTAAATSNFQPTLTTPTAFMQRAKASSDTAPHNGINDKARIDQKLLCFVDPSSTNKKDSCNKDFVDRHLYLVTKVIDVMPDNQDAELYWRNLALKSSTSSLPGDNTILKVIQKAGSLWLTSQNANNDVARISSGHRGRLFQVSAPDAPDAETLVRGSTFVHSPNVDSLVTEWNHFIHFIFRFNNQLIAKQIKEAEEIYYSQMNHHDKEKDAKLETERKIIDTNIIFGMILAATFEKPSHGNGPNSMDYFLVARSINAPRRGRLNFKAGGSICEYSYCISYTIYPHQPCLTHHDFHSSCQHRTATFF